MTDRENYWRMHPDDTIIVIGIYLADFAAGRNGVHEPDSMRKTEVSIATDPFP